MERRLLVLPPQELVNFHSDARQSWRAHLCSLALSGAREERDRERELIRLKKLGARRSELQKYVALFGLQIEVAAVNRSLSLANEFASLPKSRLG